MVVKADVMQAKKQAERRKRIKTGLMLALSVVLMLLFLAPLYISVITSLKSKDEKKLELTKELFASLFTPESGEAFASGAMQLSSVKGVDYSFSPVLGEIIDYPNKWSIAGFQRWGNEYEDVFFDVAMALALDGNADPEAFCAELDAQFSTIQ